MLPKILDLSSVRAAYAAGLSPLDLVQEVVARGEAADDPAIFISRASDEALRIEVQMLLAKAPEVNSLPLWGVPFAVKDNIDAVGLPTTAGCPAYAFHPAHDSTVVSRLRAAGAIVIGKTNLDQFATGLNGTRSPYGSPRSVFDKNYVSGGSSSGSAVAVASGLVTFSLGTDTAGSGRIPAAFNNIVGIKPTPGLVPNTGVVPACRSVDVVTVFAATVGDGATIRKVMEGYDAADPYSRSKQQRPLTIGAPRIGILPKEEREFFGNTAFEALYDAALRQAQTLGATLVPIDYAPFREAAELLYNGPWVAERLAAVKGFLDHHADDLDPTVRAIIEGARDYDAVDAFEGLYRLEALRQKTRVEWDKLDILLLPTSPTTYSVEDMLADPIAKNAHFGRYTNFANLFGYAAIAIPAGFDAQTGLPAGVTLIGPGYTDDALAPFADTLHRALAEGMGKDRDAALPEASRFSEPESDMLEIVVVGAHLSGMPLNHELTGNGGRLVKTCRTAGDYRLFALPDTTPPKPGLVRDPGYRGDGLEVEVWQLPAGAFGRFVAKIPAPLGIGKVRLDDGSERPSFLCEAHAVRTAEDITHLGGWRGFINRTRSATKAAP